MSLPRGYLSFSSSHLLEGPGSYSLDVQEPGASQISPLETARLLLRPFARTDLGLAHAYFQALCTEPAGHSIEDTRQQLSALLLHQDIYGFSPWAVFTKPSQTALVGICGFFCFADKHPQLQADFLSDAFINGYAREALAVCLQFGRHTLHLAAIGVSDTMQHLLPRPVPQTVYIVSTSPHPKWRQCVRP